MGQPVSDTYSLESPTWLFRFSLLAMKSQRKKSSGRLSITGIHYEK